MTTENRTDWAWLANTYWYVPPPSLPALQLDPDKNTLSYQIDQTVWHITGYENGYLWGVTSVMMYSAGEEAPTRGPRSRPSHLTLLGTLFPSGQVQLTFVPQGKMGSVTTGLGQMVQRQGAWEFQMQMSTTRQGSQALHWANMVQTREGDESWSQLPGLPYSVPQMLDGITYPSLAAV